MTRRSLVLAALAFFVLLGAVRCLKNDHPRDQRCSVGIQDLNRTWEVTLKHDSTRTANCSDPSFDGIPFGSYQVTTRFPDPQLKSSADGRQIDFQFGYLGRLLYGSVDALTCGIVLSLLSSIPGDPGEGPPYYLHCAGEDSGLRLPLGGLSEGDTVFVLSCGSLSFPENPWADSIVTKADCELSNPTQVIIRIP